MTRSHRSLAPAVAVLAALLVSGCDAFLAPAGGPYPDACDDLRFSQRRCTAIVEAVRREHGIDAASVVSVHLAAPRRDTGTVYLGGGPVAELTFHLADGSTVSGTFFCGGVGSPDNRACVDAPRLMLGGIGIDRDVPCGDGEDPRECAKEPPAPAPDVVAAARPLVVPALDIPLDRVGPYAIEVGKATLPDGYLSERSFELADDQPTSFWIDGGVILLVRPDDARRPPVGSRYREPFRGLEPVTVFLRFSVTETTPGALLEVRNVVVR